MSVEPRLLSQSSLKTGHTLKRLLLIRCNCSDVHSRCCFVSMVLHLFDFTLCILIMHLRASRRKNNKDLVWRAADITARQTILTFVPDTPENGKSSEGRLLPAPRESHPSEFLSELPPLVATVLSRSTCGWTGVSLSLLRLMAIIGSNPIFTAGISRSPTIGSWRIADVAGAFSTPAAECF